MFMYNMPPPCMAMGRYNSKEKDVDIGDIIVKVLQKMEKKKEKEKKKSGGSGNGPSPFQLAILLTAISPMIGPATLWAASYMIVQTYLNLQAIVPH